MPVSGSAEQASNQEAVLTTTLTPSDKGASRVTPGLTGKPKARASAGDDSVVESEPTRHVDYLSHAWNEEDIWSSWRHIVAKRECYENWPRLENASWRTWAKSKHQLKTISPETLNW